MDGLTGPRVLSHADVLACPHLILSPEHYRDDGTCRCDDASHAQMASWGYRWAGGRWVS